VTANGQHLGRGCGPLVIVDCAALRRAEVIHASPSQVLPTGPVVGDSHREGDRTRSPARRKRRSRVGPVLAGPPSDPSDDDFGALAELDARRIRPCGCIRTRRCRSRAAGAVPSGQWVVGGLGPGANDAAGEQATITDRRRASLWCSRFTGRHDTLNPTARRLTFVNLTAICALSSCATGRGHGEAPIGFLDRETERFS
jgi:hypothetical protein